MYQRNKKHFFYYLFHLLISFINYIDKWITRSLYHVWILFISFFEIVCGDFCNCIWRLTPCSTNSFCVVWKSFLENKNQYSMTIELYETYIKTQPFQHLGIHMIKILLIINTYIYCYYEKMTCIYFFVVVWYFTHRAYISYSLFNWTST